MNTKSAPHKPKLSQLSDNEWVSPARRTMRMIDLYRDKLTRIRVNHKLGVQWINTNFIMEFFLANHTSVYHMDQLDKLLRTAFAKPNEPEVTRLAVQALDLCLHENAKHPNYNTTFAGLVQRHTPGV